MAEIEVVCPKCGTRYGIDEESLGRRARCKKCDTRFELASSVVTPGHSAEGDSLQARQDDAAPASTTKTAEDNVPAVWQPGDVILDLYEVKEVLGEGGFGTVYRVHHRGWNVDLAVKCPRPDKFRTEREKERFVQECQTWVDLGLHPHTVSCHYVRTLGGIPRVFAEYVEGGTLKDRLPAPSGIGAEGEGPAGEAVQAPNLKTTLDLAIQICWGMAFAHSKGLVHRDLKPANVLVTSGGTAKVTDFGLARHGVAAAEGAPDGAGPVSVQVSTGAGTPGYAAPEQVSAGRAVDHRADIFAFGVTLWRMLGGPITWADDLRKSIIAGRAVQSPSATPAATAPSAGTRLRFARRRIRPVSATAVPPNRTAIPMQKRILLMSLHPFESLVFDRQRGDRRTGARPRPAEGIAPQACLPLYNKALAQFCFRSFLRMIQ